MQRLLAVRAHCQCIMHITRQRNDASQSLSPASSGQKVGIGMSWLLVLSLIIQTSLLSTSEHQQLVQEAEEKEEKVEVTCREINDYTICRQGDVLLNVSQLGETNSLSIHDLSLIEVREDAFVNLTATGSLSFGHGNRIFRLTRGSFRGLANLNELNLDNNRINLAPYLFSELNNLQALYLSFNRIDRLPEHTFDGLFNLKRLFLRHNRLKSIEKETFVGLTDLLQFLRLDNNKIDEIVAGSFDNLREMTHLHLEQNLLDRIAPGTFRGLKMLRGLFLDYNALRGIKKEDFDGLNSLQILDLQFNQITDIEVGSFDNLTGLRKLNLKRNKLTRISKGIFDKLGRLYDLDLSYNFISIADPPALNSGTVESFHFLRNNFTEIDRDICYDILLTDP
ncbi:PREDICTED: leucine-rich repeat-containing protein 15-like [Habropoda laboriosa]|uniref:leucine-rich repeat-containing protein 15-like n=1 Tax=Habropoda laboriosa TaxID=597456 RepID=UPI00083CDE6F|nr:PREDICTED: leucine-rich repeat-containing protein 15-like [Habropoda laboriosa]